MIYICDYASEYYINDHSRTSLDLLSLPNSFTPQVRLNCTILSSISPIEQVPGEVLRTISISLSPASAM